MLQKHALLSNLCFLLMTLFSSNNVVQVWDCISGRELLTFKAHDQEVFTCMFSPDDINVVSCSADKTVKVLSEVNVEM